MIIRSTDMDFLRSNLEFVRGSKKYFISTLLMPPMKRKNIVILYNFSRYVDDLIDEENYSKKEFEQFMNNYMKSFDNEESADNFILDLFTAMAYKEQIPREWIVSLLDGVKSDLEERDFKTVEDTIQYTYGVAEVVGLMVSKLSDLNEDAYEYARYAGRAAQWANFLRDAYKDFQVGRVYFPGNEINGDYLLPYTDNNFIDNISRQIERYWEYRNMSKEGYKYLPWYLKHSVELAGKLDDLIVSSIEDDPTISFNRDFRFRDAMYTKFCNQFR